jgi:glycosyltransferase involved in cell wall biosynthesis
MDDRPRTPRRSAIAQDWFFAPGGAERVAEALVGLLADPDVYTSFADGESAAALRGRIHTWPLQRLLGPTRRYRSFLPLYPLWFSRLDLSRYDLVVSSCSAFAKSVRTRRDAIHVAYIHTPMRYAWDRDGYLAASSLPAAARLAAGMLHPWLRRWDQRMARRPDVLVANSTAVRDRIREFWGLDAELIFPPVGVDDFPLSTADDGYLLVVSRVHAYRRLDLLVRAATALGRRTIVVGDGPELPSLRAIAGPTVEFVGFKDRDGVREYVRRCHAYVVPGNEAFGIAPVEAMAAGKPVIAFRGGGALDTVLDGVSGVFFDEQTPAALATAIERLDTLVFDPAEIRANAERFSPSVFRERFVELFRRLGVDPSLYVAR